MAGLNLTPITPRPTPPPPTEEHAGTYVNEHVDFEPVLLAQLQDELVQSRRREALWISLVCHLAILIILYTAPHWFPRSHELVTQDDLIGQRNMTMLQMPPGLMKRGRPAPSAPPSNRSTAPAAPQMERPPVQQARESRPKQPTPSQSQPQQAQQLPPQDHGTPMPQQQQRPANTNAMAVPQPAAPKPNPFAMQGTAGSLIQQAARNAGRGLDSGGSEGFGGDVSGGKVYGGAEIMSDTQGVDFDPYMKRVVNDVRMNWYSLIPDSAMPPFLKKGKVTIEFAIMPDGRVAGMSIMQGGSSGDVSLDRAAWGGITKSDPFQPLPKQYKGPYLRLRFRFYYNPDRGELK